MRRSILASFLGTLLAAAGGCQSSQSGGQATTPAAHSTTSGRDVAVQTKESQSAMSPEDALQRLRAGNARFVAAQPVSRDLQSQVRATAKGQYPYAVVLSCVDSRQPVEMIFDQGIGDLFNARVAGNVLNDDILGSLEFACKASGSKLILVLGHSNCGAVKGSIDNVQLGHLSGLLDRIKPAVSSVSDDGGKHDSHDEAFVQRVADANVHLVMRQIRDGSPILREMIDKHEIALVGGMYDLKTGRVTINND